MARDPAPLAPNLVRIAMLQDLDPLRHPAAFALSRTAVARGMMMPVWMVLDAHRHAFANRFMRNSLKMAGASRYH